MNQYRKYQKYLGLSDGETSALKHGVHFFNDRSVLSEYKLINSKYLYADYSDEYECDNCYEENTYSLYQHIVCPNKFAVSHENYAPGAGHDIWIIIADLSNVKEKSINKHL